LLVIAWVALTMLARYSRDLPKGRSVLLGSPVHGSSIANQLVEKSVGKLILGSARHGLTAGCQVPVGYEIGVIAGVGNKGVARLFSKLPGPNDGTVTVAETSLPDATDRIEVECSHFGLLLSAEVANHCARFLKQGKF